eukprot:GFYU01023533.1.p2 GENE.GFYU01023533.1~~GFYU01023533.1.p2  ORF type:complete len:227 (+),score=30.30 GFYU01023533.1:57-683(+)
MSKLTFVLLAAVALTVMTPGATAASLRSTYHLNKKNKLVVKDVPTVPSLNVTEFLGTWYQMYTDNFNGIFERNPFCATAQYGLNPNGTLSVRNIDRVGAYNGTRTEVQGYAYQVAPQQYPGRLAVVFPFNPVPGPYWIVKMGAPANGQYPYAVVTDNNKLSLFVLARDPAVFNANYDAEVKAFLAQLGFNTALNTPVAIPQGPQCTYF